MSISLTRILQQITGLNTFFQGPNAGRSNGVVLEDSATVTWSTDGQGNIQATAAGGSSSGPANEVLATPNGSSGTAALRALVSADLPVGSASQAGAVKVDGTTITATAGVISAIGGGMQLIQNQTLSSTETSVTFSSIPQTFTHLKLVIVSQTNNTTPGASVIEINFNGDVGANYSHNIIFNGIAGSTPQAAGATGANFGYVADGGLSTAASHSEATVPGYATALSKGCSGTSNSSLGALVSASSWSSTAAITSITLTPTGSFSFLAGSVFSLYGMS